MKAAAFAAALLLMGGAAQAAGEADADVFDKFIGHSAPECVDMENIAAVATVTQLGERQFEFVRALYVALPPVSRTLPPGDKAVMANSGDAVMLALVADGQACARFLAPDFITAMVIQVGMGEAGHIGTPAAYHLFVLRPDGS